MLESLRSSVGKMREKMPLARFSWDSRASMYWGAAVRRLLDGWS